mmetsp:Transcript_3462/g.6660  ORF Transcript_3462/g.6660 Transcript_3462/m.6660 type:complete len:158 (+) Transcript_3462:3328-3801(+)
MNSGISGASDGIATGKDTDIFRDTSLRYLGYANELGEAFRPIAPQFVVPSYCVAFGYVICDTLHKSSEKHQPKEKTIAAVDTLVWQTLASVAIPGFTINKVVKYTQLALEKQAVSKPVVRWAPVLVGLGVIPLIIHPIDTAVHVGMDKTIRKFYQSD